LVEFSLLRAELSHWLLRFDPGKRKGRGLLPALEKLQGYKRALRYKYCRLPTCWPPRPAIFVPIRVKKGRVLLPALEKPQG